MAEFLNLSLRQENILIALIGGLVPALIWLFFWLREDNCKGMDTAAALCEPEPKPLIALTFLAGMFAVPFALVFQRLVEPAIETGMGLLVTWALIEELLKYGAFLFINYKSKFLNEATDPPIYMLVAALGFAAAENSLFLFMSLTSGNHDIVIISQSLRFVGASLLHVVSSGLLGIALGLTFFKKGLTKKVALFAGIFIATALHALFNYLIIVREGLDVLQVFSFVWVIGVALVLLFEKLKYLR